MVQLVDRVHNVLVAASYAVYGSHYQDVARLKAGVKSAPSTAGVNSHGARYAGIHVDPPGLHACGAEL